MDRSSAGAWMLLATFGLPALIAAWEAWHRKRGLLGWVVNVVVTVVTGLALTALLVGYSHDLGLRGEMASAAAILGGLTGGSLIALWIANRFRG